MEDTPEQVTDDHRSPEFDLWCAALLSLVEDGRTFWQGKKRDTDAEQAFDDLCRCGPMVRYVCSFTGHDPEWICQGFISWCETDMA